MRPVASPCDQIVHCHQSPGVTCLLCCQIPQALPGSKMASAGADWRTNPITQINWGIGYIKGRYGTPCSAWAHSNAVGWY